MEKRQRYSAEFKREAVRLLQLGGKPAAVLARELGVPRPKLHQWAREMEQLGSLAFPGSGRPKAGDDELVRLKRENARLKEENDILKKAAAYFARELP